MTDAERERAAIVEWLREEAACALGMVCGANGSVSAIRHIDSLVRVIDAAADEIERGGHHKEDSKHG